MSVPPTEAETIAAATGGNAEDFVNAMMAPASPSRNSCSVLFRMAPVAGGFQVALDKTVDLDHPASYQIGVGSGGHATFSGGGLKEVTSQLRNGVLRIDDPPVHFNLEMAFGSGGSSSALIHRQCLGLQTVLLYVVKNPDKLSDGANYWLWVKSGKHATLPPRTEGPGRVGSWPWDTIAHEPCLYHPAPAWGPMRFSTPSARGVWEKCTAPGTRG